MLCVQVNKPLSPHKKVKFRMVYIPASFLAVLYSALTGGGLLMALIVGVRTNFDSLTGTHCGTYEYWPSVSSTIGNVLVGRVIWRTALLFAFAPRVVSSYFMYVQYSLVSKSNGTFPAAATVMFLVDLVRMAAAVGWTLISSPEAIVHHQLCFGVYMASGFVLHILQTYLSSKAVHLQPSGPTSFRVKLSLLFAETSFALLTVKFFIDHVTYCSAGLYSRATLCEWLFSMCNLAFDASQAYDLPGKGINLIDGSQRHHHNSDPGTSPNNTAPSTLSTTSPHVPTNYSWILWAVDLFLGFQFWGMCIQLYQATYFVPMVAMQFTPEVAMSLAPLFTLLWYLRPAERLLRGRAFGIPSYVYLYVLSAVGYLTFDIYANAGSRIIWFGVSTAATVLALYSRVFYNADIEAEELSRVLWCLPLGAVVSMCLRILHIGLDPLHTDALYNVIGITMCLFSAYVLKNAASYKKGSTGPSAVTGEGLPGGVPEPPASFSPFIAGSAFGLLCSLTMVAATNGGLLARYVAIAPFPSAIFVVAALLAGLVASGSLPQRLPTVIGVQIVGFLIFNFATTQTNRMFERADSPTRPTGYGTEISAITIKNWYAEDIKGSNTVAFFGGLVMVFGIGAAWPLVAELSLLPYRAHVAAFRPKPNPLASFEVAAAMSQLLTLMMHIYVVCFPFVPGGFLFRDRIQIPYVVSILLLGLALHRCQSPQRLSRLLQPLPIIVVISLGVGATGMHTWPRCVGAFLCISCPRQRSPQGRVHGGSVDYPLRG